MPVVNGSIKLDTWISAFPSRLRDLMKNASGLNGPDDRTVTTRDKVPIIIVQNRLHELIGNTHRVVRILVLNRNNVLPVETHVKASRFKGAGLLLFMSLTPDKLFDVWVVDIEHHHLGGPSCVGCIQSVSRKKVGARYFNIISRRTCCRNN